MSALAAAARRSYLECTARQRLAALLDEDSWTEFVGPAERVVSPHLATLGLPPQLDDGIAVGAGRLQDKLVLAAAQEGGFLGGAVGEAHGAKLTGLLERAARVKPAGVLLLLDTGGVRLHEANAGLVAIAEIQRAVFAARHAGVPVIVLIGGANGCYGGLGIVAGCCDHVIMSEQGRVSVSGPEVIESARGVEEFDARDRALVWRTMGAKHRYLQGHVAQLVEDDVAAFRAAAASLLGRPRPLDLDAVERRHAALAARLARFGAADDPVEIWRELGVAAPEQVPLMEAEEFTRAADGAVERFD
jgi:malonate decarboxylase beta subunit